MGEEPNRLRKYFCNSSCQNSIHIMYLSQVSLNKKNPKSNNSWNTPTHLQCLYASIHSTSAAVDMTLPLLSWFTWQMLILPVSPFLEGLWNSAKLGMGVTHYMLCLLVEAANEEIKFYLSTVKFALALLNWNFEASALCGKKIELSPCKWKK